MFHLALIVPVYNEEGNILPLVRQIHAIRKDPHPCPYELILVNNGCRDRSAEELAEASQLGDWIKIVTLQNNRGYGGGIQEGLSSISESTTHLGWIPADHQYRVQALTGIWNEVIQKPEAMHHGWRTQRKDGAQSRFVSRVYTKLCQIILGLKVKDINGLPKIFPRSLWEAIDFPLSKSFLLDSQLLLAAQKKKLPLCPYPVTFYARRSGTSSWSSQRFQIYRKTFVELFKMRLGSRSWFQES